MIKRSKNKLEWLEFEQFQNFKEVQHGILHRHGGHSPKPPNSLNLNLNPEYSPKDIKDNLDKVAQTFNLTHITYAKQVHGSKIEDVNSDNFSSPFECDAFTTQSPHITLLIKHADCQAALFYDPVQKAIASVHCGWRGNILNIYLKTVLWMQKKYSCKAENIFVGLSPSLGPKNAEFKNYKDEFPQSFWDFQVKPNYFNLWEIAKSQLRKSGILSNHIECAEICTYENNQDFFSYRNNHTTSRNASFLTIKG